MTDNNQQQQQQPKQFAQINKTDIDYDRIRQIYLIKQQISNRLNNFDLILFQQQSYSTIRFCRDCKKSKMYPPLSTLVIIHFIHFIFISKEKLIQIHFFPSQMIANENNIQLSNKYLFLAINRFDCLFGIKKLLLFFSRSIFIYI